MSLTVQTTPFKPVIMKMETGVAVLCRVLAAGSYPTGGENLTPVLQALYRYGGNPNVLHVLAFGKAGFIYSWDRTNSKLMVFCNTAGGVNTALGEHSATTYVAGIIADEIYVLAFFGPTQG